MSPSKKAKTRKPKTDAQRPKRKTQKATVRLASAEAASLTAESNRPIADWKSVALRVLALLVVIAITVYIYSIRDRAKDFAAFGYPGIFLVALMANATVFLPAPGLAIIYAMGAVFNPLGIGLAAGVGGALGELSGFLAGYSGQAVVQRAKIYERIAPFVEKYGGWTILVLAAIPNPFFDIAGVAAGIVKMPVWKFFLFCLVGQLIKMTLFAYAGKYSIGWLSTIIN